MKRSKQKRKREQEKPSGESKYGRKHAYCSKHKLWGWEVPEPKPWKGN